MLHPKERFGKKDLGSEFFLALESAIMYEPWHCTILQTVYESQPKTTLSRDKLRVIATGAS